MKKNKMSLRQRLLKMIYPFFMLFQKISGRNRILVNENMKVPPVSFYDLSIEAAGKTLRLEKYRGRKVMIVNTASYCGYTAQYEELQKLYFHSKEDLEIIAIPSNDFNDQEKGSDEDIRNFCINKYSIRFPVAKKAIVKKLPGQHEVFRWLTSSEMNGWNNQEPEWNFSKYLISAEGVLTHYFHPSVSPLSRDVIGAVHD